MLLETCLLPLLLLIQSVALQKKFWVEVKPGNSKEKKLFMVVHDDGVTATANPESATFPDTCEVELNMADAGLLDKQKGIIIGVRNPETNKYRVQLHHIKEQEDTIKKLGSPIVEATENQLKWNVRSDERNTVAEQAYLPNNNSSSKPKTLPARPTFNLYKANADKSQIPFVSPHTAASLGTSEGSHPTDVCPSPPQQRSQLVSPSSRSETYPAVLCALTHFFSTCADPITNIVAIEALLLPLKQTVHRLTPVTTPWLLHQLQQL